MILGFGGFAWAAPDNSLPECQQDMDHVVSAENHPMRINGRTVKVGDRIAIRLKRHQVLPSLKGGEIIRGMVTHIALHSTNVGNYPNFNIYTLNELEIPEFTIDLTASIFWP